MADLLVEIGTEELPAKRVRMAAEALRDLLAAALVEAGLLDAGVADRQPVLGTPRRLAAFLPGVREGQADRPQRMWGPPVSAAFDAEGKPTKAGEGFARSSGVALEAMGRAEKAEGKPPYLYADVVVKGRTAAEVIAGALPEAIKALPFKRTMRWPQSDVPFARPIRSLVVLLGADVVPCRIAGVEAGRTTRGHRFLAPAPISLEKADLGAYAGALLAAKVVVGFNDRRERIAAAVETARERVLGLKIPGQKDPADADLLEEVTGLVEWPTALTGSFEPRYMDLPPDLLVTAMSHHLRYFPVLDAGGMVRNRFVSITDREEAHAEGIREGNERVLRARLFDAAFFFAADRRRTLEDFRPGLANVDFHKGLGTLLDKSDRVRRIAAALCDGLSLSADNKARADRAGVLLKCDLLTEVVKEFPELQGRIAAHYAGMDGEDASVAAALAGQYLPRGEWDPVLDDRIAAVLSLAEKTDSLAAYFSVGEEPTGAADPYGLRRHALGLLRILAKKQWRLSVSDVLAPAVGEWRLPPETVTRLVDFVWGRAEQMVRASGYVDFADTVGKCVDRPFHLYRSRLEALRILSTEPAWKDLVALVERTGNMGEASAGSASAVDLPEEAKALKVALEAFELRATLETGGGQGPKDLAEYGRGYVAQFGTVVATLFEKVLVQDKDQPERTAAIRHLLHEVFVLFAERLGDLRRLGSGARPPRE
jgi:glycyl-tRNA synthetase beta chain